jgi:glycosyltransferase involved in cell wall biosynthesis
VKRTPTFSIVVPVYLNEGSISDLVKSLLVLQAGLRNSAKVECVFVVDGSPDNSANVLKHQLEQSNLDSKVLQLSRNFGSQSAIKVGLADAQGDFIAVMAADLQEPISLYGEFFKVLAMGEVDIAIGKRISRVDPALSKTFSKIYWSFYRRWVNSEIPKGGVDVFACTQQVAQKLVSFNETDSSLIGHLFWLGFDREVIEYSRQERHSGKSAWTFRKKVRYFLDSIYSFTDLPILLIQVIGAVGVSLSIFAGFFVLFARLFGYVKQPGYAPLMITMFLTSSAILFALGIVGNYVSRTYANAKNRPYAIVASEWTNVRKRRRRG